MSLNKEIKHQTVWSKRPLGRTEASKT